MKTILLFLLTAAALFAAPPQPAPKLVLAITVDQFRYDYLTRFRSEYKGGLHRLLTQGAVMVNANLEHYPTVTAIGHATFLSGATPAVSGIMGNDWYDRTTGKNVTSVSDENVKVLGGTRGPASPHRLLVSTIGDEMKMSGRGTPRVIGVSLKDRSAILPVGRRADAAYWYDPSAGSFVTSTYYLSELPAWVKEFNERHLAHKYAGAEWAFDDRGNARSVLLSKEAGPGLFAAVYNSPFGNELLEAFAEEVLRTEKLGQRDVTDLLSVSFSSNDAVGHVFGPDAPEVRDMSVRTDQVLGKFFDAVDKLVGLDKVLVIFTADHGLSPLPETLAQTRMPGGRTTNASLFGPMSAALESRFGKGQWLLDTAGTSPYLNQELIREKQLDPSEVERVAARALSSAPHVLRVYTREQLLLGQVPPDRFSQRVVRSFNPQRSGDLEVLLEPYWIRSAKGTTHGTPYSYDAHVPLIFMGPGIKAARYYQETALNDVAPTLASILDVEIPSGSVGKVLHEILQQ